MQIDPAAILTGIITLAGGGTLAAFIKAWSDLRKGARSRERDTFGSMRTQRNEAEERDRRKGLDVDFYHRTCGQLVFQLVSAGIAPNLPPEWPVPPSQREPELAAAAGAAPRRIRRINPS